MRYINNEDRTGNWDTLIKNNGNIWQVKSLNEEESELNLDVNTLMRFGFVNGECDSAIAKSIFNTYKDTIEFLSETGMYCVYPLNNLVYYSYNDRIKNNPYKEFYYEIFFYLPNGSIIEDNTNFFVMDDTRNTIEYTSNKSGFHYVFFKEKY